MFWLDDIQKFHRQKPKRSLRKVYQQKEANQYLNLDCKSWQDLVTLEIFETGLANKMFVEQSVNQFMQKYWDVWEVMTFEERNHLFLVEYEDAFQKRRQFLWSQLPVMIPFFSLEMNRIYTKEPLVLEFDQYYRLYRHFDKHIIDMGIYQNAPLKAGFSKARYVLGDHQSWVLYDERFQIFLIYQQGRYQNFLPLRDDLDVVSSGQQETIAKMLLEEDKEHLLPYLIEQNLCHKRLVKRYERKMRRNRK